MSVFKVLPKHKSIQELLEFSKSERKLNAQIPEPCKEINFNDFTQNLLNECLRLDMFWRGERQNIRCKENKTKNNTHKSIVDNLPDFAKNILKYPGVCIAGGSIVNTIRKDIRCRTNDIDIFVYGLKKSDVVKMINKVFNEIKYKVNDLVLYRNMLQFEIGCENYQLILIEYNTPQEIIQNFDIGACQVCITNTDIYITDYARFCFLNNVIIYDTNQCISSSYDKRIYKYHTCKQFSLVLPNLQQIKDKSTYETNEIKIYCPEYSDAYRIWFKKIFVPTEPTNDNYVTSDCNNLFKSYANNKINHTPYFSVVEIESKNVVKYTPKDVINYESKKIKKVMNNMKDLKVDGIKISQENIDKQIKTAVDKYQSAYEKCQNGVLVMLPINNQNDMVNAFTLHYSKHPKEIFGSLSIYSENITEMVI